MCILLFPSCPSEIFGVYPFEIARHTRIVDMSRTELHRTLGNIPEHLSIRCIVLFYRERQRQLNDCLTKLREFYSSDIVIIGGVIDRIRSNDETLSTCHSCGFVLTGDRQHLRIRQVVLEQHISTREAIRDRLKQLAFTDEQPSTMSFGVQVSCVARGSDFYQQQSNVECNEFRQLYPRTPLIGIFGKGELGHDYLPNSDGKLPNDASLTHSRSVNDLFRTYSSVFSHISIRM
jgi:hypothetical protein